MSGPAQILVVDDDERIRRILVHYLTREGYSVREAGSGEQMRTQLATESADLVLLDVMLPDADGFSLARELSTGSGVAIIMLTGKAETVDKIVGLEVGADDYITKPFDQRELLARVRTVLRRTGGARDTASKSGRSRARFAGWALDLLSQELVSPEGAPVHLTSNQFRLLASLVTRPNRVLTREEILDVVSGRDWSPLDRSIDVLVGKLRKKIETDSRSPSLIKTIRGVGYKFTTQVEFE